VELGGRPRGVTAGRAKSLALKEAYRMVRVKVGDSIVFLPAIQAILRGQVALAAKGNGAAQRAVIEKVQAIEQELALEAAAEAAETKATERDHPSRHGLQPGTILVREWDGEPRRVMVLDEGFAWNGTTYRSLTEIAFAMTGTRWSGPRFFGLRSRAEKRA
jgi:hypothetical protein